ncbi:MAG: response regulator [Candidatus Aminicenantales bacterium]
MNILIVDDQEDNRYLLKTLLTGSGYQVTEASNGKKALEMLAEGTWDLVISDILMPVMDGYELCKQIRSNERLRDLPFIFYTATYVDQKDEDFALKLGADRFFRKPLDPRRLLENIRNLQEEIVKSKGQARPVIQGTEKEILKLYSERLVNKLEMKMVSLEKEVAERKRTEEALRTALAEKEVLLREIHHRVKNNMQIIISLFNLQAGHAMSPECLEFLREGQTRIRTMSLVHEKLYHSGDLSNIDLSDYVRSLAVHLFHIYLSDTDQVRLETDFDEVMMEVDSAVPCGMILNELISNALKHAFPDGRKGVLRIGLNRRAGGVVEIRVEDNGIGLPEGLDFRQPGTFGLQVVNLLAGQLEAKFEHERGGGTAFTVSFCDRRMNRGRPIPSGTDQDKPLKKSK